MNGARLSDGEWLAHCQCQWLVKPSDAAIVRSMKLVESAARAQAYSLGKASEDRRHGGGFLPAPPLDEPDPHGRDNLARGCRSSLEDLAAHYLPDDSELKPVTQGPSHERRHPAPSHRLQLGARTGLDG
jgi:hypothetical protein